MESRHSEQLRCAWMTSSISISVPRLSLRYVKRVRFGLKMRPLEPTFKRIELILIQYQQEGPDVRRPERDQVIAHATLSAWLHHWPSQVPTEVASRLAELLADTQDIRSIEASRWMTQRRI